MKDKMPIKQSTMTEEIYEYLQGRIVNHTIKPGTHMVVSKIAKELGVSASPVRETLRLLQQDGLTLMQPHRGAISVIPTKKGFTDLFAVRRELESVAVYETAKLADKKMINALEKILINSENAVEKGNKEKWCEMDDCFHAFFRDNCNNDTLKQMLSKIAVWVVFYRQLVYGHPTGPESLMEHKQVFEKISNYDPEGAAEIMKIHIDRSLKAGIEQIGSFDQKTSA